MKRVVITGVGAITPIGNNSMAFWKGLCEGQSGAQKIDQFDTTDFKTKFACLIRNYNPEDHFERKEHRKLDLYSQYGLVATKEAIQNAEMQWTAFDLNRVGVLYSSGVGGFETFEKQMQEYFTKEVKKFNPFFIPKLIANALAGHISIKYGLRGVNYAPVTACASSTQALIQAFNYIRLDKADAIIVGGSEAPITQASIGGFNAMRALSTNNEAYATASRPFDTTRDGFVAGEGAGTLVVESLDSALERDAPIVAEIVGGGETADAYHITGTHPEGKGAKLAMELAMQESKIKPEQINYLNAHATSTGIGDISEIKAIQSVFGKAKYLKLSATKSMTGHLLGATGAIEAIATVQSIQNSIVPATINTSTLDPCISIPEAIVLSEPLHMPIEYAMSNSFGFGGHCASVVFKKFIP